MSPLCPSVSHVQTAAPAVSLPQVALLATGGTIAGVAASPLEQIDYAAGVLGVERMLESLPGIEGVARIVRRQCANLPSENCTPEHWALLAQGCALALQDPETCGAVLTHGTDTLEESAFYLYLTLPPEKPVVLTGAMRPATSLSADGPINIRDAVAVAASPAACGRGALLVMNGRILSARTAIKIATVDVEAFAAPESGGLGRAINGQALFFADCGGPAPLAGAYAALAGRADLPGGTCATPAPAWAQIWCVTAPPTPRAWCWPAWAMAPCPAPCATFCVRPQARALPWSAPAAPVRGPSPLCRATPLSSPPVCFPLPRPASC